MNITTRSDVLNGHRVKIANIEKVKALLAQGMGLEEAIKKAYPGMPPEQVTAMAERAKSKMQSRMGGGGGGQGGPAPAAPAEKTAGINSRTLVAFRHYSVIDFEKTAAWGSLLRRGMDTAAETAMRYAKPGSRSSKWGANTAHARAQKPGARPTFGEFQAAQVVGLGKARKAFKAGQKRWKPTTDQKPSWRERIAATSGSSKGGAAQRAFARMSGEAAPRRGFKAGLDQTRANLAMARGGALRRVGKMTEWVPGAARGFSRLGGKARALGSGALAGTKRYHKFLKGQTVPLGGGPALQPNITGARMAAGYGLPTAAVAGLGYGGYKALS